MVFFAFSFRNRSTDRRESALALADFDFDEIDFLSIFGHRTPIIAHARSRALRPRRLGPVFNLVRKAPRVDVEVGRSHVTTRGVTWHAPRAVT